MEKVIELISVNWPTVVQYACMIVAYFLVFLFRGKINATSTNLKQSFKENVAHMKDNEKTFRADMRAQVEESKQKYNAAIDKISTLERELQNTRDTINILIGVMQDEDTESENS